MGIKNLGLVDLSGYTWDEAMDLLSMFVNDGWEVTIKVQNGVYAVVKEVIAEFLEAQ